ncbi:hypothetical protein BBJ28_00016785 [Nothophytophthora sp. Chile5]|nr:hypothetical protein BBJ28_00016785 [Nothophytophthora sp. Chile5]
MPAHSYVTIRPLGATHASANGEVMHAPMDLMSSGAFGARPYVLPRQRSSRSRKGTTKVKSKPMNSSERGVKFRQKQQERQIALLAETETLRQQVLRLQELRDLHAEKVLTTPYTATGSPLKFVKEYFDQFRNGLRVPGASTLVLSSEKQNAFLNAMIEPYTTLGGTPAVDKILSVWQGYSTFHSSVKLACVSMNLITTDNCSTVVAHGVLHLRYSRRTIENVFPHAVADEDLVQKLIGRQLQVHFKANMHFNARGKLEGYEVVPDFVGALMEILGDLQDCNRMMGRALVKEHVLGEKPEPEMERMPVEIPPEPEACDVEMTAASGPSTMDLAFILS